MIAYRNNEKTAGELEAKIGQPIAWMSKSLMNLESEFWIREKMGAICELIEGWGVEKFLACTNTISRRQ